MTKKTIFRNFFEQLVAECNGTITLFVNSESLASSHGCFCLNNVPFIVKDKSWLNGLGKVVFLTEISISDFEFHSLNLMPYQLNLFANSTDKEDLKEYAANIREMVKIGIKSKEENQKSRALKELVVSLADGVIAESNYSFSFSNENHLHLTFSIGDINTKESQDLVKSLFSAFKK